MKARVLTFEGVPLKEIDLSKVLRVHGHGSFDVLPLPNETGRDALLRVAKPGALHLIDTH